jgi:[ribosomal protein S5]-alanine N-acetyltransferase
MPTRIIIRPPTLADQREFLKAARASERLHEPWVTAPTSPSQFRANIERMAQPSNAGFLICSQDKQQIM